MSISTSINTNAGKLKAALFVTPWLMMALMAVFWIAPSITMGDNTTDTASLDVLEMDNLVVTRVNNGMRLNWDISGVPFAEDMEADCIPPWQRSFEFGYKPLPADGDPIPEWGTQHKSGGQAHLTQATLRDSQHNWERGHRYQFRARVMVRRTSEDAWYASEWVYADGLYPSNSTERPEMVEDLVGPEG